MALKIVGAFLIWLVVYVVAKFVTGKIHGIADLNEVIAIVLASLASLAYLGILG